jgi:hypothetical protein
LRNRFVLGYAETLISLAPTFLIGFMDLASSPPDLQSMFPRIDNDSIAVGNVDITLEDSDPSTVDREVVGF